MLILKGNTGKSFVIKLVNELTDCVILSYEDSTSFIDENNGNLYTISPDNSELSKAVEDFILEIEETTSLEYEYEYIIIYTNLKEDDEQFQNAKEWLKKQKLPCVDVIMICKEAVEITRHYDELNYTRGDFDCPSDFPYLLITKKENNHCTRWFENRETMEDAYNIAEKDSDIEILDAIEIGASRIFDPKGE